MFHWALNWTGGLNGNSRQYLELSGFLSIILPPLFTLLGLWLLAWYHSRCHVTRCPRHGKYPFKHYKLCKNHHPLTPQGGVSHLHIMQLHKKDQEDVYER